MAKSKSFCAHCDSKISRADAFCPKCSQPTMFATVEQRTTWELEQWSKKGTSSRKKAVSHVESRTKPARVVEQLAPRREVASIAAMHVREPIKRVQTPKTIHPAVAARAARQAEVAASKPAKPKIAPPAEEKRVIVLPDAAVSTQVIPTPTGRPARVPRQSAAHAEEALPSTKEPASKKAASPKRVPAASSKPRGKATSKKAPKMAPMPVSVLAVTNGHETNGHKANGNGHASNGNGVASAAIAEQTEILRELLRRVAAIEEKMPVASPRARRFRLRRR